MTKKLKKRIKRVGIGAIFYIIAIAVGNIFQEVSLIINLLFYLIAYLLIGGDVVKKAITNIGRGQVFDENFLMTLATVGAFFVGDFAEAVAVMLFYQVGECFQSFAVNKSRKSITELMDIRPDYANVIRNDSVERVAPEEVAVGEIIVVKPGERVPMDGTVIKGSSSLDTKALTGESMPREVAESELVISGCVNQTGVLEVRVDKVYGESTVAKILDLVENASSKKAKAENFITKFARYYTPIVVICAVFLALIPPLILGGGFGEWIYRGLTFLVISCPCALVISIPLSFFGGLGGASKLGVLVKGSNYLEALAQAEIVVMDKTGTLTKGNFAVSRIVPDNNIESLQMKGISSNMTDASQKDMLLEITAYAESSSNHPISKSLLQEYGKEIDRDRLSNVEEIAGHGVKVVLDGIQIFAGNDKLMIKAGITYPVVSEIGTIVYVATEEKYLGYIVIADEIKADAKEAIAAMKKVGVKKIVMLTGDRKDVAEHVADELGITDVYSQLLPGDKVDKVEMLMQEKSENGKLLFVGDGINDAPVLARADIGIAMGGLGADAAIEAADVVIMTDEPEKIAKSIKVSTRTIRIVKQNIVFAIGIKIFVLLLAAIGFASMWAAIFADVGVAVIAIINAMRALNVKNMN